jgi:two-component system, NarL family, response regulator DevR
MNGVMLATRAQHDDDQHGEVLRVLLVDDHQIARTGTRHVLETSDRITVVDEAGDGYTALLMIETLHPNLVLLDVRLPDRNGIDIAHQIALTHPGVRVVMLTAFDDDTLVREAFEVGVTGYLLKAMPGEELISAVLAAGGGAVVIDPILASQMASALGESRLHAGSNLTLRERETVELVAQGLSNRAIGARLGVSVRTIEGHLNHAFSKLGIESRTELVRFVLTHWHE